MKYKNRDLKIGQIEIIMYKGLIEETRGVIVVAENCRNCGCYF